MGSDSEAALPPFTMMFPNITKDTETAKKKIGCTVAYILKIIFSWLRWHSMSIILKKSNILPILPPYYHLALDHVTLITHIWTWYVAYIIKWLHWVLQSLAIMSRKQCLKWHLSICTLWVVILVTVTQWLNRLNDLCLSEQFGAKVVCLAWQTLLKVLYINYNMSESAAD